MQSEHVTDDAPLGFDILYREGPCIVVAKPGGLLTQAPPHIDSLERRIKAHVKQAEDKPGKVYLGVPHRLDRPVSGALVVARHVRAARKLSRQFEERTVRKCYWCIVEGAVSESEGVWEDYLRKIPDEARGEVADAKHEDAKHAKLHYRTLLQMPEEKSLPVRSLLQVELHTGRMHQIRLQAAHRSHPILGDTLYGATTAFGPDVDDPRARWIALHGRRLAFLHPMSREPVDIIAPLPTWWPPEWESLSSDGASK